MNIIVCGHNAIKPERFIWIMLEWGFVKKIDHLRDHFVLILLLNDLISATGVLSNDEERL